VVATITDIVIGGWLVDTLIKRGNDATRVRKTLFTIGLILGIAVIGAAFTTNANVAIIWISIALGGLAFAAPIGWSIPGLIGPKGTVGTVGSIMNFFNNLAGIIAPIAAGFIFDRTGSFAANFLVAVPFSCSASSAFCSCSGKSSRFKSHRSVRKWDRLPAQAKRGLVPVGRASSHGRQLLAYISGCP
jgi:MFS family permease